MYCLLFLMGSSVLLFGQASEEGIYLKRNAASWAIDLNHQDPRVRRAAAYALGKLNKHAVPYIAGMSRMLVQDRDAAVRSSVADSLGILGSLSSVDVSQALKRSLEMEKEPVVLRAVIQATGKMGQQSAPMEALVRTFLSHKDNLVRKNAVWALGQFGSLSEAAIPSLIPILSDSDVEVRAEAISSLGNLGILAQDAIPHLVNALSDKETLVQEQSILALRKMGPAASSGIPPLLSVAESDQKSLALRQAALVSLEVVWPTGHKDPASWQRLQQLVRTAPIELRETVERAAKKIAAIRQ